MKVITGSKNLKKHYKYPVITLGNFDGVHRGHKKIIQKVISTAQKHNGTSMLYTFDPHPVRILSPHLTPPLLQTLKQKIESLESLGLDVIIVEPFTKILAGLNAEEFLYQILVKRIGVREIVIGYDFTFGLHRTGKVEDLEKLADPLGIKVHIIDAIFRGESLLSSTHIRHFVERGELSSAKTMLGRPYSIEGRVIKGRGIGAELGYHTANLSTNNELIPPPGVYITATKVKKTGKKYPSVTNIGYNPTFGGTALSVETYLLDFNGKLINQELEIEFYKKIRREMTFENTEELRNQIRTDVAKVRNYYEKRVSL